MARRRLPADMLAVARSAGAAWSNVVAASQALERAGCEGRARTARALRDAERALRRAYRAMVPGRLRPPQHALRVEPLWRCRYCGALIWEQDRRAHLRSVHVVPDAAWTDAELGAHFEERDEGDEDEDAEENEKEPDAF